MFSLRLFSAVGASAMFGLVAAAAFPPWSLLTAIGLGFLFGTAFVGGTGYRIIAAVWAGNAVSAPASWSGAAAASASACALGALLVLLVGGNGAPILLAYGLAINVAYVAVKFGCMLTGCCHADVRCLGRTVGLRTVEVAITAMLLAAGGGMGLVNAWLGALVGIGGHCALRLFSRAMRGRFSTGWPPLRQPGAELAPLQLLTVLSGIGLLVAGLS